MIEKGAKWWNNGKVNKRSVKCPGEDFVLGRISYSRKSPSDETKEKIRQSNVGKIPWIKGRQHTEESLRKMRAAKQNYIPWNKGLKVDYSWNRGLTADTDDRIKSYQRKQTGQIRNGNYVNGKNHPQYREDTKEYKRYRQKVDLLTEKNYVKFKDIINPENKPRTLCGVEGGYQLDHIYPVYLGYMNNIPLEEIAKLENLRIIPWKENLAKKYNLLNG
jgi:hypothetical protein